MNSFLDKIFMDNAIREYLVALGIILAVLIFRNILSKWTAVLISRLVTSKKKVFNRQRFQSLVLDPIRLFMLVLAVIIAADRLNFPDVLSIDIYKSTLHDIVESIARGVLIGSFIWLCNRMIIYTAELLHEKAQETTDRTDDQLIIFFRDFLKVLVWIIGVLLILKYSLGFNIGNMLTGLSIVGAALALAFRESLENLIASFIIFFDKPFTVGDLVKVENVTGSVEKIGLRSTRIRTVEKTFTTVPNKKMVDSILDNHSLRLQRNVTTKLEISLLSSPEQIELVVAKLEHLLHDHDYILDWNVYFSDTGMSAHVVQLEYFVSIDLPIKQFFKLKEKINLSMLALIRETGLQLAAENAEIIVHHTNK